MELKLGVVAATLDKMPPTGVVHVYACLRHMPHWTYIGEYRLDEGRETVKSAVTKFLGHRSDYNNPDLLVRIEYYAS